MTWDFGGLLNIDFGGLLNIDLGGLLYSEGKIVYQ